MKASLDNIIMRLRNDSAPGQDVNLGILPSVVNLMSEAADELEKLREVRNSIRVLYHAPYSLSRTNPIASGAL
jgi:hypothetical protein